MPEGHAEGTYPKAWETTDRYKYPVPKPHGDHWEIILERFLMKDKLQCDAWKDEVQNLLLFAGLFSAVVTAFVVESYKSLQPDPNVALTFLLTHIATGIDTLVNNSEFSTFAQNVQNSNAFYPTPASVHINIFWFCSLILSLATVIIGIVSLQWLREHQKYTEPLNSKQALAVFHLRSAALDKWGISHVFTTLPLLLQAAVVLFFIGLGEFLLVLSPTVAIAALVFISLPMVFLIATTVLPTLQLFFASIRVSSIPIQCPYKSPQSWAFLHLALLGMRMMQLFNRIMGYIPWSGLKRVHDRFFADWMNVSDKSDICNIPIAKPTKIILHAVFSTRSWIDFDITWLNLRDAHYLSQQNPIINMTDDHIRPHYDLVQALISSASEHAIHEQVILAAYHGMKYLCEAIVADHILNNMSDAEMISRVVVLQSGFAPFRSLVFQGQGFGRTVVQDETMLAFLLLPGIRDLSSNPSHPIGLHRMELFTRMLVYNRREEVGYDKEQVDPAHPFLSEINDVEKVFPADMVQQQYLVLEQIFFDSFPSPVDILTNARYSMLSKYFNYIACFRSTESLESNFLSILSTISRSLAYSLQSEGHDNADFLFFCARLYLENLARHLWFSDVMKSGSYKIKRHIVSLIGQMLQYERQLDKSAYHMLTQSWEIPTRNNRTTYAANRIQSLYTPIPEALLRFIPYEQRNEVAGPVKSTVTPLKGKTFP